MNRRSWIRLCKLQNTTRCQWHRSNNFNSYSVHMLLSFNACICRYSPCFLETEFQYPDLFPPFWNPEYAYILRARFGRHLPDDVVKRYSGRPRVGGDNRPQVLAMAGPASPSPARHDSKGRDLIKIVSGSKVAGALARAQCHPTGRRAKTRCVAARSGRTDAHACFCRRNRQSYSSALDRARVTMFTRSPATIGNCHLIWNQSPTQV